MEAKVTINKNRKGKIALSYITLIILVVLLFLPLIFRITFVEKVERDEQIVTTLSCVKENESITGTFLNDEPQVVIYNIKGDYQIKTAEEISENDDENVKNDESNNISLGDTLLDNNPASTNTKSTNVDNELFEKLRELAEPTYNENEDMTTLRINVKDIIQTKDYESIFNNLNNQEKYYTIQGFTCNKKTEKF